MEVSRDSPLGTPSIRTNDNPVPPALDILFDVRNHQRFGVQVVDRNVEKPLDLTGVQVHGNDVITASDSEHVSYQFCSDRSPRLVLLVHPCVGETGDHCCDPPGRCPLAGGSEDEEFHKIVIDVVGPRLDDENVFVPNGLRYFNVDLPV